MILLPCICATGIVHQTCRELYMIATLTVCMAMKVCADHQRQYSIGCAIAKL